MFLISYNVICTLLLVRIVPSLSIYEGYVGKCYDFDPPFNWWSYTWCFQKSLVQSHFENPNASVRLYHTFYRI